MARLQAIIGSVARRPRPPAGHSVAKVPAFVTACEGGARADAEICLSTLIADTAVESVAVLFASAFAPTVVSEPSAILIGCVDGQNVPLTGTVPIMFMLPARGFAGRTPR